MANKSIELLTVQFRAVEAEISLLEEIIKSMEISLCIERETIRKIRVAWLKYHDSGPIEALKCIKEIHALLELKEEEE